MDQEDTCSIPNPLIGYENNARDELQANYEALGLKYYQPQLGGTTTDVINQAIAWLDIHPLAEALAAGYVIETAKKVSKLFNIARDWYKKHPQEKIKNIKVNNSVIFNINFKSKQTLIELNVGKDYSTNEIIKIIEKAIDQKDK